MIGSRPVVGSSKKMMSGSAAMARARPTRFCMPPESSAGDRSPTLAARPTCASTSAALSRAGAAGDALLRQQLEADILPDRQAVEQRAVLEQHADAVVQRLALAPRHRASTSRPSTSISAGIGLDQAEDALDRHRLAGARAAQDHHRVPGADVEVDAVQHLLRPEGLATAPRRRIFGPRRVAHRREEHLGQHVVERQDQDGGRRPPPRSSPRPRPARRRASCSRTSSPSASTTKPKTAAFTRPETTSSACRKSKVAFR